MSIPLKPVHDALHDLNEELAKLDLTALDALPVRRQGATRNAAAWMAVLRLAEQELVEWCPDGGNSFVIPLAPRLR